MPETAYSSLWEGHIMSIFFIKFYNSLLHLASRFFSCLYFNFSCFVNLFKYIVFTIYVALQRANSYVGNIDGTLALIIELLGTTDKLGSNRELENSNHIEFAKSYLQKR